jgi:hypothetical protein
LGVELFAELSQLAGRTGALRELSCRRGVLRNGWVQCLHCLSHVHDDGVAATYLLGAHIQFALQKGQALLHLGYQCITLRGLHLFRTWYGRLHIDQYPAVLSLLALESTPFYTLSDCTLAHPEPMRGLLNRQALMLHGPHPFHHPSAPLISEVHFPYLRPSRSLEASLVALSRDRLAWGFRGLFHTSPGRRLSSELDLLVGGRDRWTG